MRETKSLRHRLAAGLGLAAVAAMAATMLGTAPAHAEGTILGINEPDVIPGHYLVKLRDVSVSSVDASAAALAGEYEGTVTYTFPTTVHGFAATMTEEQARRLAADPSVEYVEADQAVHIDGVQPNPPSWGLDRVDQNNLPLDSSYTYPNEAANVHAYIIDTGILISHNTFGGRAAHGRDTVDNDNDATDCHGHGTHVAGTVGGSQYGLAKSVQLVGVRVLNCSGSGTTAGVVAGIEWVTQNAVKPASANMSLGGGADTTLDNAVTASIASGVTYGVAAGNDNANACNYSPARVANAITVGSTTNTDARSSFSNFGTCVDIFAPGSSITSSWIGSNTATNTISGTSMATPHVVGAASLYLSANPSATPQQVRDALVNNATNGVVTSPGTGSPNKLLYTGFIGGPPPGDDFSISVSPASGTINQGQSTSATVTTATTNGSAQSITLSASGQQSGVTVTFSPSTITSGQTSTVTFTASATAGTGTANISLTGTGTAATHAATYTLTVNGTGGGGCSGTNGTSTPIADLATVNSTIAISGCNRNASATSTVAVNISHTYRGDLVIDLIAPDGTAYRLKNSSLFDGADNVITTYTANLSSEAANGSWTLRVRDVYSGDSGTLNTWTLTL
ncbi:S8 family peptidase [Phytomonospora sp. NPDC050363]|uniref:S8 family peptidase n=1 Tax=Phytomonospora sp. NPDC050363 TaxID=3155642 RepID=UPI0033F30FC6